METKTTTQATTHHHHHQQQQHQQGSKSNNYTTNITKKNNKSEVSNCDRKTTRQRPASTSPLQAAEAQTVQDARVIILVVQTPGGAMKVKILGYDFTILGL